MYGVPCYKCGTVFATFPYGHAVCVDCRRSECVRTMYDTPIMVDDCGGTCLMYRVDGMQWRVFRSSACKSIIGHGAHHRCLQKHQCVLPTPPCAMCGVLEAVKLHTRPIDGQVSELPMCHACATEHTSTAMWNAQLARPVTLPNGVDDGILMNCVMCYCLVADIANYYRGDDADKALCVDCFELGAAIHDTRA